MQRARLSQGLSDGVLGKINCGVRVAIDIESLTKFLLNTKPMPYLIRRHEVGNAAT